MRAVAFVSAVLLASVCGPRDGHASVTASAEAGYGFLSEIPLQYHGVTYTAYPARGPTLAIGGAWRAALGGRWDVELRGRLRLWQITTADTKYPYGGGKIEGGLTCLVPTGDAALRVRIGDGGYLEFGPSFGIFSIEGSVGSGTSRDRAKGTWPLLGGTIEGGISLGKDSPWSAGLRGETDVLLEGQRTGGATFAFDVTMAVTRAF